MQVPGSRGATAMDRIPTAGGGGIARSGRGAAESALVEPGLYGVILRAEAVWDAGYYKAVLGPMSQACPTRLVSSESR